MISKAKACTIHQVFTDPGGRYVALLFEVAFQKVLLVNIYLPPPFQVKLLYDLLVTLAPHMYLPVLFMGDYNNILDSTLDSSNANRPASAELSSWASVVGLTEMWHYSVILSLVYHT